MFARDAICSYDRLMNSYSLRICFEGWKKHLDVDRDEDHAGDFARIFEPDRCIGRKNGLVAITHAWASARLLKASIDHLEWGDLVEVLLLPVNASYALHRLRFIFLKALSRAETEEQLVLLGDLLAAITLADSDLDESENWCVSLHGVLVLNGIQANTERPLTSFAQSARALLESTSLRYEKN